MSLSYLGIFASFFNWFGNFTIKTKAKEAIGFGVNNSITFLILAITVIVILVMILELIAYAGIWLRT